MTTQSDRRQAELAVIEAARGVCKATKTVTDLYATIYDLDQVGLVEPGRAKSNSLLLTSQNAAAYMNGKRAKTVAAQILWQLRDHYMTTDELVQRLDRPHQTVSARVNELRDNGWIEPYGDYTRLTRSGQPATIWRLTGEARKYAL